MTDSDEALVLQAQEAIRAIGKILRSSSNCTAAKRVWIAGHEDLRCYGEAVRIYLWVQILLGWILTTLWVTGFSGSVRNGSSGTGRD